MEKIKTEHIEENQQIEPYLSHCHINNKHCQIGIKINHRFYKYMLSLLLYFWFIDLCFQCFHCRAMLLSLCSYL